MSSCPPKDYRGKTCCPATLVSTIKKRNVLFLYVSDCVHPPLSVSRTHFPNSTGIRERKVALFSPPLPRSPARPRLIFPANPKRNRGNSCNLQDSRLSRVKSANCKTDKDDDRNNADPFHDLRHHDHGPQEQALVLLLLLQEGVQGRGAQEGAPGQREAHEREAPVRQGGKRAGGPTGGATLIQGEKESKKQRTGGIERFWGNRDVPSFIL